MIQCDPVEVDFLLNLWDFPHRRLYQQAPDSFGESEYGHTALVQQQHFLDFFKKNLCEFLRPC